MHFEICNVTFDFLFCYSGFPFLDFIIKPFWIKGAFASFFSEDNLGVTCRKIVKKVIYE